MAVEELEITTDDGETLQAELDVPAEPVAAVLLAHPHPQAGGSMRSIITGTLFRELPGLGAAVLRFNFRGVEGSTGEHDFGRGEQRDIVAALAMLHPIIEGLPLVLSGWSFGADTSLAVTDERIDAWVAIAPPLRTLPVEEMGAAHDPRPKRLVVPENDQFRRPDAVREMTADWVNTDISVVQGGDHFLVGRLDAAVGAVSGMVRDLSPEGR